MADFAARVNQALPVGGLSRKGKQPDGVKERQTKTEKRLHKMYAEWREEEARRKEKLEELKQRILAAGCSVQYPFFFLPFILLVDAKRITPVQGS